MDFPINSQLKYGILEFLGYAPNDPYPQLITFRTAEDRDAAEVRIATLLDQLGACKEAIIAALPDSMAVKLDTLQVDYRQHLSLLNRHGLRLTEELSAIAQLPIRYTYFRANKVSTIA